jgi:hypothetical protein
MDEINIQLEMPAWEYSILKGNTNTAIQNCSGQLQRKK